MSTRKGLSRLSTSTDQLNAVYNDTKRKRWDAEAVWLMCPTISNEAARRLGADWALVDDAIRQHLINESTSANWRKKRCARIQARRLSTCTHRGGRVYVKYASPVENCKPRRRKPRRTMRVWK